MGYFQVRFDPRVVNYDKRGFIRLATEVYRLNKIIRKIPEGAILSSQHLTVSHFCLKAHSHDEHLKRALRCRRDKELSIWARALV